MPGSEVAPLPSPARITRSTVGKCIPALGHAADQCLVLDRPEQRACRPGVADVGRPRGAAGPVQQAGVTLVRAQLLEEQLPTVHADRREGLEPFNSTGPR